MPARDFTKPESVLFYVNVCIAVIGVVWTSFFSKVHALDPLDPIRLRYIVLLLES